MHLPLFKVTRTASDDARARVVRFDAAMIYDVSQQRSSVKLFHIDFEVKRLVPFSMVLPTRDVSAKPLWFPAAYLCAARRFRPFRSFGPLTRFTWSHDSSVVGTMFRLLSRVLSASFCLSSFFFRLHMNLPCTRSITGYPFTSPRPRIPIFRTFFPRR